MEALICLMAINISITVTLSLNRKKNEKLDVMAVIISAAITTAIYNILAIIEDTRMTKWLLISLPIGFIYSFCVSVPTNMLVQRYILRKRKEH